MAKAKKYKLEIWVKSPQRAIGIIERLWAVGELNNDQRQAMIQKIDSKYIQVENERQKKLKKLFAEIGQKINDSTAN
ncbi:MAG: hypothetical protein IJ881_00690 [Neisseriaceae bacterium]|nr:hypothetical protein [Neisseriaceae bacterium]